jgi:hypothetical protein
MELVFICLVCIIIGIIIGENSSSSKRRSYENRRQPSGPPPLKLKKSLRLDESLVQRTNNRDGPSTPKPDIIPKGQSRKRRFSDDEIENLLREAFIKVVKNGGYQPIKQQGTPEPPQESHEKSSSFHCQHFKFF